MKWRKWTALLLAAVMLLGLAACGEAQNFTAEKLSVWIWDKEQLEVLQSAADSWTEKTHIPVEFTVKDRESYWADVDKGVLPDILWVDSAHAPAYAENGTLLQLDSLLEGGRTIRLKDYNAQTAHLFQLEGHTYAIPKDSLLTALWYNKALFDSLSLSYPDETWTWETLYETAKKLTNRHNGYYGIAIAPDDLGDGWYNLVYSYGGSILTADENGNEISGWASEETLAGMELMGRIIADCMPSQPTLAELDATQLFASGRVAMVLQNSEQRTELLGLTGAVNWSCALLPYCDRDGSGDCGTGERVSVVEGNGWAISARCADSAAAFSLLETLCSKNTQTALAALGGAQSAYTGAQEAWGSPDSPDFAVYDTYRTTLSDSTLIPVPQQLPGETWLDHALDTTLYTLWNDPGRMETLLRQQQSYTDAELLGRQQAEEEPAAEG